MNEFNRKIIFLSVALAFTGCATAPQVGHEVSSVKPDPKNEGAITLTGSSSRYIVKNKDGSFCFGPPPDASFTDSMGASFGLTLVDTSKNDGSSDALDDAHQRLSLGGRNPNVLISREILFETCLLMEKAKLNPEQMLDLYNKTIDAIVKINSKTLDGDKISSDNGSSGALTMNPGSISESSSSPSSGD
jgi:hypothetical protein